MSVGVQSGHTGLSAGVRGKTRLTFAHEAARETASKYNRMSAEKPP